MVVEDWDRLTFRVNREAYRSPEIFAREIEGAWLHSWLYLGHESELSAPGDYKVRTLAGRPLIFCRDGAGRLHAFLNSCPHRGTILCRDTEGSTKHFQCFYHAWTFRTDGEISSIPDADAYESTDEFRAAMRLREVPRLDIHEGFVFVSFDPDVPPLAEHLGAAADYLTMIEQQHVGGMTTLPGVQLYSVRGNWKLAVENAMDGYHFSPTHNTFVGYLRESGYAVTDEDQYAYNLGRGHGLLVLTGHGGRISMIWEPRFGEDERLRIEAHRAELAERLGERRAHYIADESHILYVWPNLLVFDIEGLSIRQLEPVSAGITDVRAWQLVPRHEQPAARALRMKTVVSFVGPGGLATPDDIEAYECVQRGIAATAGAAPEFDFSDMSRGMLDEVKGVQGRSIDEGAMRGFWRHWVGAVGRPGDLHITGERPAEFLEGRELQ
jgi:phenylpropionate dioxygenase-like ring-hydroxylating dioxygenase large terminal subunit